MEVGRDARPHLSPPPMISTSPAPHCIVAGLPDFGIYVSCLASYNSGDLYGAWIDLERCSDKDDIEQAIEFIIENSPNPDREEYAIHDSVGLPDFLNVEYPDLGQIAEFMEVFSSLSEGESVAYFMLCNHESQLFTAAQLEMQFLGVFDSEAEFARKMYAERGIDDDSQNELFCYVDWERVWRGEFWCNSYFSIFGEGGYWIFHS